MIPLPSTITPEPRERSRRSWPPPLPPPGPPGICPPPCPPCPPKKRSKKSWNGLSWSLPPLSSSGLPGVACPLRRCGLLMVDSVRMLTTAGSSCRAICENCDDSCVGEGTVKGEISPVAAFSLPLTPADTTVPIRMPSDNVARITTVEAKRFAFIRCHQPVSCKSI